MVPLNPGQLVVGAIYIRITTCDERVHGKNGRNVQQPSNAYHQNNIMFKSFKIAT
jgi:hypothetical protein